MDRLDRTLAAATDAETPAIVAASIRAGVLRQCGCGWICESGEPCEDCGAPEPCEHIDFRDTLDGAVCTDCGHEREETWVE